MIELNLVKAIHGPHKLPFFVSSNNVILSEGLADGSIPPEYFRSVVDFKNKKYLYSAAFEYICVYDFEAWCDKEENGGNKENEIIEFPVVIIDVKAQAIKSVFHTYVKPTIRPEITPFCTELTGITQEQVDGGMTLQHALRELHLFLGKEGIFQTEFIFLSCGDYDGKHLKEEAALKGLFVPNYLKRWINIKKTFPLHLFDGCEPVYDFSSTETIRHCKPVTKWMTDMLETCKLPLLGKHHSGIDDAKNIAGIVIECLKKGATFS